VIEFNKVSMMFSEKHAPGLDPGVVHPRIKSEDKIFGIMLWGQICTHLEIS
jgi:hypothetical protein